MDRTDEWARLCALIDDDETVREQVVAALAAGDDPWSALLDGLDDAGVLAYLQADDTGMELTDALAQLPRVFVLQPDLDDATDTDDLGDATAAADRILAQMGFRVLLLVEEDDAWPVVVVRGDAAAEIRSLAARLGHEVRAAGPA